MIRAVKWLVLVAMLLAALCAGLIWWAGSSENALEWALRQATRELPGKFEFSGLRGSLWGGFNLRQITYKTDELSVELNDITFSASQDALLHARIEINTLSAAHLKVTTASSDKPPELPRSLKVPIEVTIAQASVKNVDVNGFTLSNISLGYAGGAQGHTLRAIKADSEYGHFEGELQIAADQPFKLSGAAGLVDEKRYALHADVSGNLSQLTITARGQARNAETTATAQLTPFAKNWLEKFTGRAQRVDLASFGENLPATDIAIDITGAIAGNGLPTGTIKATNSKPGAITAERLPVKNVQAIYSLPDRATIRFTAIQGDLGSGGQFAGTAQLAKNASRIDLTVNSLNLNALHTPLRATRLNGQLHAEVAGETQRLQAQIAQSGMSFAFDATRLGDVITLKQFHATAGTGSTDGNGEISLAKDKHYAATATVKRLDPSAFGQYPSASLNGELHLSGVLAPAWRADVALTLSDSLFRGMKLVGDASAQLSAQGAQNVKAAVTAGANTLRATGDYGRSGDVLTLVVDAHRLDQLDPRLAGHLNADGRVTGTVDNPNFDFTVAGNSLNWQNKVPIPTLRLRLTGTYAQHSAMLQATGKDYDVSGRISGSWDKERGWQGTVATLENSGAYPAKLVAPMSVAYGRNRVSAGPAEMLIAGGRVSLSTLSWENGKLDTQGRIANVPVAPLLALAGTPAPRTDLRIGGAWTLTATPRLTGTVTLARESGDIVLPGAVPVSLLLTRLQLDTRIADDAVDATLAVQGASLNGRIHATTGSLEREAPVKLDGKIDIDSLQILNSMVGTQALFKGRASVTIAGSGTVAALRLTGSATASDLGIEAPQYGARLHDGRLTAELTDTALVMREFTIRGDEGNFSAKGMMARAEGGGARLEWKSEHLLLLNRPDMQLQVDGSGTVALADKKLVLRGALRADRGNFRFDRPTAPTLGSDVVVLGQPRAPPRNSGYAALETRLLDIDVALDAGDRLHIVGAGIDADLRGKVSVKTTSQGILEAYGTLSSANGVYTAFGQRLSIERGRLTFGGPLDNPGLDILAKRKNLAVEAGVEIRGTVHAPIVTLVSDPPVPDNEKLAWLTLGHGLDDASGADLALLQSTAAALVGKGDSVPLTQRFAKKVGLDEVALRGVGEAGSQVAAFGKRLSDKVYIEYQQGLTATNTVLRLSYALSRNLSLRVETGFSSGFGLSFTRSYE